MSVNPLFIKIAGDQQRVWINPLHFVKVTEVQGSLKIKFSDGDNLTLKANSDDAKKIIARLESMPDDGCGNSSVSLVIDPAPSAPPAVKKMPSLRDALNVHPPNQSPSGSAASSQIESILANNWIEKHENHYVVHSLDGNDALVAYRWEKKEFGEQIKIVCDCWEFQKGFAADKAFRCEHILALKEFTTRAANANQNEAVAAAGGNAPRWTCHHMTRSKIEKEINAIAAHPKRGKNTEYATVIAQIKHHTANKNAPEALSQSAAEELLEWLVMWRARLDEESEQSRAA